MISLRIAGNRNSFLQILIPENFVDLSFDCSVDLKVLVSSGAWVGSEIEVYVEHRLLLKFLKDLKELILTPGLASRLVPDKTGSPNDIEILEASFLFIHVASSTATSEVWVYGHVQQTDYRAKLSFSFEVEHEKLKLLLDPLRELKI